MSVEWLKKQKRIQKQTEPKGEKQKKKKSSKVWKVKTSDYLPKTPEPTKEQKKKMETLTLIQKQLKNDEKSKAEKEQREEEFRNEINQLSQQEKSDYNELISLAKQKAENELETSRLLLENERLVNIQYKQNFENYRKHMKETGVTVDVNPDYIKKVLKKDG